MVTEGAPPSVNPVKFQTDPLPRWPVGFFRARRAQGRIGFRPSAAGWPPIGREIVSRIGLRAPAGQSSLRRRRGDASAPPADLSRRQGPLTRFKASTRLPTAAKAR